MRQVIILILLFNSTFYSFSQTLSDSINKNEAERIITYLASDKLKGRVNFTKEQVQAAEFIGREFREYSLEPFPGNNNYFQAFQTTSSNTGLREKINWNGKKLADSSFTFITYSLRPASLQLKDFTVIPISLPVSDSILFYHWKDTRNILLWLNLPANTNIFENIKHISIPTGFPASNILIAASPERPEAVDISENKKFTSSVLYNIVGILPGRSKPNEAIIFSAHYDHIDKSPEGNRNGIFNGANDNASGTTAVLMLARYFSMRRDNERTLVFCLFAGEELGFLGSTAFISEIVPESIKAVINIEMIGVPGVGKNKLFITGAQYSDISMILKRNIGSKNVEIKNEELYQKQLFGRSDNYPFALKGIPAHSIMCSDDTEPCYHQPCDEAGNIDIGNMTTIIQAIARGCKTLINGKDTPVSKIRVSKN